MLGFACACSVTHARDWRDFAYFELMPTSALLAVDRHSPACREHGNSPMFYAQSWLTAH